MSGVVVADASPLHYLIMAKPYTFPDGFLPSI